MNLRLLALIPALVIPVAAGDEAPFLGTWSQLGRVDPGPSIQEAIEHMPFLERSWAQYRLTSVNPLYDKLVIATEGDGLSMQMDNRPALHLSLKQPMPWTREDKETFQVTMKIDGKKMIQTIQGKDGKRTNTFTVGPDGKTLRMAVEVVSHRLGHPVKYEILFSKS